MGHFERQGKPNESHCGLRISWICRDLDGIWNKPEMKTKTKKWNKLSEQALCITAPQNIENAQERTSYTYRQPDRSHLGNYRAEPITAYQTTNDRANQESQALFENSFASSGTVPRRGVNFAHAQLENWDRSVCNEIAHRLPEINLKWPRQTSLCGMKYTICATVKFFYENDIW